MSASTLCSTGAAGANERYWGATFFCIRRDSSDFIGPLYGGSFLFLSSLLFSDPRSRRVGVMVSEAAALQTPSASLSRPLGGRPYHNLPESFGSTLEAIS